MGITFKSHLNQGSAGARGRNKKQKTKTIVSYAAQWVLYTDRH